MVVMMVRVRGSGMFVWGEGDEERLRCKVDCCGLYNVNSSSSSSSSSSNSSSSCGDGDGGVAKI